MRAFAPLLVLIAALAAPFHLARAAEPAPAVADIGRFTIEVRGQGPDVILIPGLASSREVWSMLVPTLARTHRVHLVQIAGFAGLPAGSNADGAMLDPLLADLRAYIAGQTSGRASVIGHSMGGLIGLKLAQAYPEAVDRLMIVDAVPFISAMTDPAMTLDRARPLAMGMRGRIEAMPAADFETMQTATATMMTLSPDWRPRVAAWTLATDRRVMARAVQEVMLDDARPGLAAMTTPVTVLYAWDATMRVKAEDVDALYARNYQGLAAARMVRVDGAYHFLMLDQPDRFAAEAARFLE